MTSLLPASSDHFEIATEGARVSSWGQLNGAVPYITSAKRNPPPSYLPFLVWEYGLGMLTPYIPNLYDLIDEGVRWFRIRGTYAAVAKGLSFVGIAAAIEPAWHGRAWWNSNQLRFPALPDSDDPLLERIEAITRLSLPFRSDLRRGVFQHDVPAAEADSTALDGSHLDCESGVRLADDGTVWSFGRTTEFDHTLTEAEGTAIGNWIAPVSEAGLAWSTMNYPWATATFPWATNPASVRRAQMAAWFSGRTFYARFKNAAGEVIGYRRVRSAHPVALSADGPFSIGSQKYAASPAGEIVFIEAMTDFEDAFDVAAASVCLMSGLVRAPGIPAGRLWLRPQDASGGVSFATKSIQLPLRKTVRERIKFLVRF